MTYPADEITAALPAREIRVRSTSNSKRPIALTIPLIGRSGRGGSAHGVLLTHDGAMCLVCDMASELGLSLKPARFTRRRWGFLPGPRRRAEVRAAEEALQRALPDLPSEEELFRRIFGADATLPERVTAGSPARDGEAG